MLYSHKDNPLYAIDLMSTKPSAVSDARTSSTGPISMPPPESSISTPSAACDKVFSVPELLEHILQFLPAKHVTRCLRINSFFKASIERSLSIQRNRFLLPVPWTGPAPKGNVTEGSTTVPNKGTNPITYSTYSTYEEDDSEYQYIELNPLLLIGGRHDYMGNPEVRVCFGDINKEEANHRFSNMFLTQPLVPDCKYEMYVPDFEEWVPMEINQEVAITLGDLKLAEAATLRVLNEQYQTNDADDSAMDVITPAGVEWCAFFPLGLRFRLHGEKWEGPIGEDDWAWKPTSDSIDEETVNE